MSKSLEAHVWKKADDDIACLLYLPFQLLVFLQQHRMTQIMDGDGPINLVAMASNLEAMFLFEDGLNQGLDCFVCLLTPIVQADVCSGAALFWR